jgi:hypothetical protein
MKKNSLLAFGTLVSGLLFAGCQTASTHDDLGSPGALFQSGRAYGSGSARSAADSFTLPDAFDNGDFRHSNRATREGRIVPN